MRCLLIVLCSRQWFQVTAQQWAGIVWAMPLENHSIQSGHASTCASLLWSVFRFNFKLLSFDNSYLLMTHAAMIVWGPKVIKYFPSTTPTCLVCLRGHMTVYGERYIDRTQLNKKSILWILIIQHQNFFLNRAEHEMLLAFWLLTSRKKFNSSELCMEKVYNFWPAALLVQDFSHTPFNPSYAEFLKWT